MSWYHGTESQGQAFPESPRFAARSFQYQVERLDMIWTVDLTDDLVRFERGTPDEGLMELLARLAGERCRLPREPGAATRRPERGVW